MRQHGILVFKSFFEWVSAPSGKKQVKEFLPQDGRHLCAPVLFDYWCAPDKSVDFYSFAVITNEPPAEIAAAGHNRCPIVLQDNDFDLWLVHDAQQREQIRLLLGKTITRGFVTSPISYAS